MFLCVSVFFVCFGLVWSFAIVVLELLFCVQTIGELGPDDGVSVTLHEQVHIKAIRIAGAFIDLLVTTQTDTPITQALF
jgi:hypothetical protein